MKKRESKGREYGMLGRVRFRAGGREGVREKVAGGREIERVSSSYRPVGELDEQTLKRLCSNLYVVAHLEQTVEEIRPFLERVGTFDLSLQAAFVKRLEWRRDDSDRRGTEARSRLGKGPARTQAMAWKLRGHSKNHSQRSLCSILSQARRRSLRKRPVGKGLL